MVIGRSRFARVVRPVGRSCSSQDDGGLQGAGRRTQSCWAGVRHARLTGGWAGPARSCDRLVPWVAASCGISFVLLGRAIVAAVC